MEQNIDINEIIKKPDQIYEDFQKNSQELDKKIIDNVDTDLNKDLSQNEQIQYNEMDYQINCEQNGHLDRDDQFQCLDTIQEQEIESSPFKKQNYLNKLNQKNMGNICATNPETLELQANQYQNDKFFAPLKGSTEQEYTPNYFKPEIENQDYEQLAKIAKERVQTHSQEIVKAIQTLNKIKLMINPIIDPSTALIELKYYVNTYYMHLNSLLLYWIGIYDNNEGNYLLIIKDLNKLLENLVKYLQEQQKSDEIINQKIQEQKTQENEQQNEGQSNIFKILSQNLQREEQQKLLKKTYISFFDQNIIKFAQFNSLRCNKDLYMADYYKLKVKGIQNDVNSSLPAYLRASFKNEVGFKVWNAVAGGSFDVSKGFFIRKYQEKFNGNLKILQQIIHSRLNYCNTICLIDFLIFVKNNASIFDGEGKLIDDISAQKINQIVSNERSVQEYFGEKFSEGFYQHENEGKYTGSIENGVFQGKGELILKNNNYYAKGEFVKGFLNGQGKVIKYGVEYTGTFVRGLLQGKGQVNFPDGTQYVGEFEENIFHGNGELTHYNKVQVKGRFINGNIPSGWIFLPTGEEYVGHISNNRVRNGSGVEVVKSTQKTVFEGTFIDDEYAVGKLYGSDGGQLWFEGELHSHQQTKGIYHYQGGQYTGDFYTKNFQRQGKGILNYGAQIQNIDGKWARDVPIDVVHYFDALNLSTKYIGSWDNFYHQGIGEIFYQSGDHFQGEFKQGLQNGKGIYTYKNGDKYEGQFKNGTFEGQGKYDFINGDYYEGNFQNGRFNGQGTYFYANKSEKYVGEWKDDKYNGKGTLFDKNMNIIKQGIWEQNKCIQELQPTENIKIQGQNAQNTQNNQQINSQVQDLQKQVEKKDLLQQENNTTYQKQQKQLPVNQDINRQNHNTAQYSQQNEVAGQIQGQQKY
ncbi:hypothetical protein PPERSA_12464 [Pseudocohnilembus persalinus]|uniref:MORN motif n=1 Tax=Pseudocohnilembus persalinus TaxID=266149 RepID=A0A0V0QPG2_PSEPJ|nr:hypothetical protein PPERSA_12464 [Pseudocohnilembus persalinus]|eukprot:KRX04017.1 hypothetical protein PPERSA_12464 [Pseudocohnilembus persalinus]